MTPDKYLLAMALCRGVSSEMMLRWREYVGSGEEFFRRELREVYTLLGATGRGQLSESARREALAHAEKEMAFVTKHNIRLSLLGDEDYPIRVAQLPEAPKVLFIKGNASLSTERMISVVGTRKCTAYGMRQCKAIVAETIEAAPGVTSIVSGLAFGTDSCAHEQTIASGAPTVAVLAHGLHTIYPSPNRQLAVDIIRHGGALVSEYPSGEKPFRQRFLERNRIVAALSDATIVVESGYRGGSLSTAAVAFNLNRAVFAVPGRIGDEMSEGCNKIIERQQARPYLSAPQFLKAMNWQSATTSSRAQQAQLFPELDERLKPVYDLIHRAENPITADEIADSLAMNIGTLLTIVTELEMDGLISRLPGNKLATF